MKKRLFSLVVLVMCLITSAMGQITTAGISGKVVSGGEPAVGATVTAKHQPSGTVYRAITNVDGRYTIQGMRVGGPYTVEISYIGHKTKVFKEVMLRLGETQNLSCKMEEDAHELQEFVVTGRRGLNATKTGAAQSIDAATINRMPSTTHSIADIARLNPQISTTNNGAMSFAGMNNRYNSFQIDGAMNNDVFGLTANGSNGGQAGTQPVSMETIDQIQINVAPFDVRQADSPAELSTPSPNREPINCTEVLITTAITRISSVNITEWWTADIAPHTMIKPNTSWASPSVVPLSKTSYSSLPTMRKLTWNIPIFSALAPQNRW